MRKQIIEYTSPLDALISLAKQLHTYEIKYQVDSAEFFAQYQHGKTDDDEDAIDWAGNYRHYIALQEIKYRQHIDNLNARGEITSPSDRTWRERYPSGLANLKTYSLCT